jgi:5-hydroxyisourate hydrolase
VISTHVLDLARGRPAAGIAVALEGPDGAELARAVTDGDGRARDLGSVPAPGRYRLRFDTAGHLGEDAFFPEVVLQFTVTDPEDHLHVPLLLSPYGYSTYRGS